MYKTICLIFAMYAEALPMINELMLEEDLSYAKGLPMLDISPFFTDMNTFYHFFPKYCCLFLKLINPPFYKMSFKNYFSNHQWFYYRVFIIEKSAHAGLFYKEKLLIYLKDHMVTKNQYINDAFVK